MSRRSRGQLPLLRRPRLMQPRQPREAPAADSNPTRSHRPKARKAPSRANGAAAARRHDDGLHRDNGGASQQRRRAVRWQHAASPQSSRARNGRQADPNADEQGQYDAQGQDDDPSGPRAAAPGQDADPNAWPARARSRRHRIGCRCWCRGPACAPRRRRMRPRCSPSHTAAPSGWCHAIRVGSR